MAYDLVIKNGLVVDGTGGPSYHADVAVQDGRIAEIGKIDDPGKKLIDASDLVVSPGFIDPHTHYDAQICWDRLLTPSPWHGVTSLVMGHCGVGVAPCKPEEHETLAWDLVNVEGIPFDVLSRGLTWDWVSFPDYMNALERRGFGVNIGLFAPIGPMRRFVMGDAASERAASADETLKIKALVKEAVQAGALGFTSTNIGAHVGYQGRPVAARQTGREEYKAYSNALNELGRGVISLVLTNEIAVISEDERELLELLVRESGRKVTWASLYDRDDQPEAWRDSLERVAPLTQQGAVAQTSCRPLIVDIDLSAPAIFASMMCWRPALNRTVAEQIALYRDPAFRAAFRKELERPKLFSGRWDRATVFEVGDPAFEPLLGRTVEGIARERNVDPLDLFLDLAIADGLRLKYTYQLLNATEERLPSLITDPRVLLSLSDGGAHVDMLCDAGYCTYLLGHWVREKQALTLEHAIRRITSEPAAFYGFSQRGRIAKGLAADFAVFDPQTVGSARRGELLNDLPGGARRMVVGATGMEFTIVNGSVLFERDRHSGEYPGRVLRSGQN